MAWFRIVAGALELETSCSEQSNHTASGQTGALDYGFREYLWLVFWPFGLLGVAWVYWRNATEERVKRCLSTHNSNKSITSVSSCKSIEASTGWTAAALYPLSWVGHRNKTSNPSLLVRVFSWTSFVAACAGLGTTLYLALSWFRAQSNGNRKLQYQRSSSSILDSASSVHADCKLKGRLSMSSRGSLPQTDSSSEGNVIHAKSVTVLDTIGKGSFGVVKLGSYNGTAVAIKLVQNDGFVKPEVVRARMDAMRKEVTILEKLRHSNVLLFMGVCLDPLFVVTEYCKRGSLFNVIKEARSSPDFLAAWNWKRRILSALDVCQGMEYLHSQQVLHRDLKTPNLLVTDGWTVKVADFGLSRLVEESSPSSLLYVNPRWMAPEVLQDKPFTKAADVFSFGIILWELLTLQEPYGEMESMQVIVKTSVHQLRPPVPQAFDIPGGPVPGVYDYIRLMERCWAEAPECRPTFTEITSSLREIIIEHLM